MRAVVLLLLVFGATIVVYAMHWARRAASATTEASAIFQETGSLTETMRRLYAHESKPGAIRLSAAQTRYIDRNFDEFMQAYATPIRAWTEHFLEKYRADRKASPISDAELADARAKIALAVTMRFAKEWCDLRGVA